MCLKICGMRKCAKRKDVCEMCVIRKLNTTYKILQDGPKKYWLMGATFFVLLLPPEIFRLGSASIARNVPPLATLSSVANCCYNRVKNTRYWPLIGARDSNSQSSSEIYKKASDTSRWVYKLHQINNQVIFG